MKRNEQYWVNLTSWKHPVPEAKRTYTEVWGDLQNAINYAWDSLPGFGRFVVTVKDHAGNVVYTHTW